MSHGTRTDRVAERIRVELATLLTRGVRDPGVTDVTITHVRVTRDLLRAEVRYTVMSDERARRNAARGLRRANGFLRRALAERLRMRRVPDLSFRYDDAVEQQARVASLFEKIEAARGGSANSDDDAPRDVAKTDVHEP